MSETVEELLRFVQLGARLDLKALALQHILGLTGDEIGIDTLIQVPALLLSLIALLDDNNSSIAKDAALCIVNLSANNEAAEKLLNLEMVANCPPLQKPPEHIINTTLKFIFEPTSNLADPCCMILSNLTRSSHVCEDIIDRIEQCGKGFDDIINIFTKNQYNKTGANLHYLGPVLSNLSQSKRVRRYILDKNKCVLQRLLPFTEYEDSLVRRGGIVGTLRNCCFESDFHEWLLGEEVDILPRLLLPLAGNEAFDDEDNEKLPLDLQFLSEDKVREPDADIRCMLLEALTQLCSKRQNRVFIRDKNAYVILRELHKWDKDQKALLVCENLVDILIRTEEEIGHDNLHEIDIPDHLSNDFTKADEEFVANK